MATFRTGQQTHRAALPQPTRRPPPSTDASGAVPVLVPGSVPTAPTANGGTPAQVTEEPGQHLPTRGASGGRARPHRTRNGPPESHTLDAPAAGKVGTITRTVSAGTHTGRVAVRATGSFNTTTARGIVQGVDHRHVQPLQRAGGYAHTSRKEQGVFSRS